MEHLEIFFSHIFTVQALISLVSLTLMEVVLGVDNIVFISILSSKLREEDRKRATNVGLIIAIIPRVLLLFVIGFIVSLVEPIFSEGTLPHWIHNPSWRGLILMMGGVFLVYKSVTEIHHKLEGAEETVDGKGKVESFIAVIIQIALLNIVFSFDSILTAVGMIDASKDGSITIMITSVVISMGIMIIFANKVNAFVIKHPTVKMLALSFLLMIGTILIMEGFDKEVPKEYVYVSMGFALVVEVLNLNMKKRAEALRLRQRFIQSKDDLGANGAEATVRQASDTPLRKDREII
jgi:predicted tellurium resistance membrane protein TerC